MDLKNFVKVTKTEDEEIVNEFDIIQGEKELELFLHNLDKLEIVIDQLENNQLDKPLAKMLIYYGVDEELKNNNVSISLQDYLDDKVSEGEIVDVINNVVPLIVGATIGVVLFDFIAIFIARNLTGVRKQINKTLEIIAEERSYDTMDFEKKVYIPNYDFTLKFLKNCAKLNRSEFSKIVETTWKNNNMDFKDLGIFYDIYKDVCVQSEPGAPIIKELSRIRADQKKSAYKVGFNKDSFKSIIEATEAASKNLLSVYEKSTFDSIGSIAKKYNEEFKKIKEDKSKEELKEKKKALKWAEKQTVFFMKAIAYDYKFLSIMINLIYKSGGKVK